LTTQNSYLVKQHAAFFLFYNLDTRFAHTYQPHHLIYWLCNDYVYFKCSCVYNWIQNLTEKWRFVMLHKC